jgi:hypothetical protein
MTNTDPTPTVAEVLDKLAANGSARQVADHLGDRGITGWRRIAHRCPVSELVRAETGQVISLSRKGWDSDSSTGRTPKVVGEFVVAFDDGEFPGLDAQLSGPLTGGA